MSIIQRIITISVVLVIILVVISFLKITEDRREKEYEKYEKMDTDSYTLMSKADSLIKINELDQAVNTLRKILNLRVDVEVSHLYQQANDLIADILKYKQFYNNEGYKDILLEMNEEEYKKLLNNEYTKKFVSHNHLNDLYIQSLYDKRYDKRFARPKLIREENEREAEKERRRLKAQRAYDKRMELEGKKPQRDYEVSTSYTRKQFGKTFRVYWLDRGMDVDVKVSGKNNTRLTLTHVLFSDVWAHKFKKEGDLQGWKDLGFKRVDLRDGFDYHVYWTFD